MKVLRYVGPELVHRYGDCIPLPFGVDVEVSDEEAALQLADCSGYSVMVAGIDTWVGGVIDVTPDSPKDTTSSGQKDPDPQAPDEQPATESGTGQNEEDS